MVEFAIVKRPTDGGGPFIQVESITFGWRSYDKALDYVRRALVGEYDVLAFSHAVEPRLETADEHKARCCPLCA